MPIWLALNAWVTRFVIWYSTVQHHSGIALMTPEAVHYGTAVALTERRAAALAANPIRFKGVASKPPELPTAAWMNPPAPAMARSLQ